MTAWRLAWALPLVLLVGIAATLLLKRLLTQRPAVGSGPRMHVHESLSLSAQTRVHLVEVDGATHLIVESAQPTVVQLQLPNPPGAAQPARSNAAWLQRLYQAGSPRSGSPRSGSLGAGLQ